MLHSSQSCWAAHGPQVLLASLDVSLGQDSLGVSEIEALSATDLEWLEFVGGEKILLHHSRHWVEVCWLMRSGIINDVLVNGMLGHFNN